MSNTEFWVAVGEGIAIVLGVVEELIRNLILKKKKKKEEEKEDIEVTLTEKGGEKEREDVEERALRISVINKGR